MYAKLEVFSLVPRPYPFLFFGFRSGIMRGTQTDERKTEEVWERGNEVTTAVTAVDDPRCSPF